MKKKAILFIAFVILIIGFQSCRKDDDTAKEQFFYLRNKGADMPVWVEGNLASNVFVIVVHGGPGGNSSIYNTLLTSMSNPMEEKYTMVYWDQRGSGVSAGKYKNEELNIDQYVDDLDKLIELLKHRYNQNIRPQLGWYTYGCLPC